MGARRQRQSYSYRYSDYTPFPPYVTVAEKRARNQEAARKLGRQNAALRPVAVEGRTIASSWWGKSWNKNLERYADYGNRIGRGRSYLCHGAVLDLQIQPGRVVALVQGSQTKPYEVTVSIAMLAESAWEGLRQEALRCLNSLPELLGGQFPQALKDVFFAEGTGLFPTPREIAFKCSCPDWASMCKHVAAVLYGVGNRLDQQPELLFALRQVTVDELISQTVQATSQSLLERAGQAVGDDLLADADLEDVFGIELGEIEGPAASRPASPAAAKPGAPAKGRHPGELAGAARVKRPAGVAKTAAASRPAAPRRGAAMAKAAPPAPVAAKPPVVAPPRHGEMIEALMSVVPADQPFVAADVVCLLPGWRKMQVANTLNRARHLGLLERVRHGTFRRRKGG